MRTVKRFIIPVLAVVALMSATACTAEGDSKSGGETENTTRLSNYDRLVKNQPAHTMDYSPMGQHPQWVLADPREIADAHAVVTAKEQEIADLTIRLRTAQDDLASSREATRTAESRHTADIDRIGERLLQECERREWCSEYDEVVSDLNRVLTVPLVERQREFEVTVEYRVRITHSVTANNEDAAWDIANERTPDWDDANIEESKHVYTEESD